MSDLLRLFSLGKMLTLVLLVVICLFAVKLLLTLFDKFVQKSKLDPIICKILRVAV